jgi:hypothetical protein
VLSELFLEFHASKYVTVFANRSTKLLTVKQTVMTGLVVAGKRQGHRILPFELNRGGEEIMSRRISF